MPLADLLKIAATPLFAALVLALMALIAGIFGRARRHWMAMIPLAGLWIASLPVVGSQLYGGLESGFPPLEINRAETADVIIVLGGGLSGVVAPRLHPELEDAADRVWHAARLYHAGKADRVILSGGPYRSGSASNEAQDMSRLLIDLGVPERAILREDTSHSTYENARNTLEIWQERGFKTGYLVTSAGHMGRANAIFRKLGLTLMPAATDYRAVYRTDNPAAWLPRVAGLELTTLYVYEQLARLTYRMRNWI